jgi:signal transduction histidine kinase
MKVLAAVCCTRCAASVIGWERVPRLLRSTSLRLTLGYAVLFVASSLLLIGLFWWRTVGYLERETSAVIGADAQAIMDGLRYQDLRRAVATIKERIGATGDGSAVYLLADAALRPIAGNLPAWPLAVGTQPGWYQVSLVRNGRVRVMEVEEVGLPGGFHLLVGRDSEDRTVVRALIVDGLGWTAAGAVLLAVAGGVLVRRAVLHRVEAINRTADAIVHGDLSQRLRSRDTGDAFDQLAQTINVMLQQIENLVDGIRNTSNAVAHDLRTPLAELRTRLEELTRTPRSREVIIEGIHGAVADVDRVIGIFNALLRLVEIDSGMRRSGFRQVDLVNIATEVAELYGPIIEDKKAVLDIDVGSGLAVNGDPHLLAQAVGNLVDNAVKYAPCKGKVSLRIQRCNSTEIDIVVADNGPGIADVDKPRVTERFYRCAAGGGTAGSGLGLSLVEAVARLHDGSFTLGDNHPGLRARLRLPAAPGLANEHGAMG